MARVTLVGAEDGHITDAITDYAATLSTECSGILAACSQRTVDYEILYDTRTTQVVEQSHVVVRATQIVGDLVPASVKCSAVESRGTNDLVVARIVDVSKQHGVNLLIAVCHGLGKGRQVLSRADFNHFIGSLCRTCYEAHYGQCHSR